MSSTTHSSSYEERGYNATVIDDNPFFGLRKYDDMVPVTSQQPDRFVPSPSPAHHHTPPPHIHVGGSDSALGNQPSTQYPYSQSILSHHMDVPPPPSVWAQTKDLLHRKYVPQRWSDLLEIFPILTSFKDGYKCLDFQLDMVAGLSLAVVLIPQCLAYAPLAGLPAHFGVVAGMISPLFYLIFGTCKTMSAGPFALISLMIGEMIARMYPNLDDMAQADPDGTLTLRLTYIMTHTLLTGLILTGMALLKLGWLTDLVSGPAVAGLIMASSLSISISQLGALSGVNVGQGSAISMLIEWFKEFKHWNWWSIGLGVLTTTLIIVTDLYSAKKKHKIPIPSALIFVVLGTVVSTLVNFNQHFDMKIIGDIPMGFPDLVQPDLSLTNLDYISNAMSLAFLAFVMSASVASSVADEAGYKLNFNCELFAWASCAIGGSFLNSYVASASISRTALVTQMRPKTQWFTLLTSAVLAIVLILMAPLLHHLPKAILAAVVYSSFRKAYMKITECVDLYNQSFGEGIVYSLSFCATFFVGTQAGLVATFIASLGFVVIKTTMLMPSQMIQVSTTERYINYKPLGAAITESTIDGMDGSYLPLDVDHGNDNTSISTSSSSSHIGSSNENIRLDTRAFSGSRTMMGAHSVHPLVDVVHIAGPLLFLNHIPFNDSINTIIRRKVKAKKNGPPIDPIEMCSLLSNSIDSTQHVLSHQDNALVHTMLEDTLAQYSPVNNEPYTPNAQTDTDPMKALKKITSVIIVDMITDSDITSRKTLSAMIKAHPDVLFLFSSPSLGFTYTFVNNLKVPANYHFKTLHVAYVYALVLLNHLYGLTIPHHSLLPSPSSAGHSRDDLPNTDPDAISVDLGNV